MVSYTKAEFEKKFGKGSTKLFYGSLDEASKSYRNECLAVNEFSIVRRHFVVSKTPDSELYACLEVYFFIHKKDITKRVRYNVLTLSFYPSIAEYHLAKSKNERKPTLDGEVQR